MEKFTIHPVINSRISKRVLEIGADSPEGQLIKISPRKGAINALKKANIHKYLLSKFINRVSVNHYKPVPNQKAPWSGLGFFYID